MYAVVGATGNRTSGGQGAESARRKSGLRRSQCRQGQRGARRGHQDGDRRTRRSRCVGKGAGRRRAVFMVTGHNPKSDVQQINVIEAAKAAGAEYIVKVSGGRDVIGPNVESVNGQAHYKIEEHLSRADCSGASSAPACSCRTSWGRRPTSKNDGKIIQPWPKDMPVALIDVRDTGALGARVLREPGEAQRQDVYIHRQELDVRRVRQGDRRHHRQAAHLRRDHAGAGRSRDEVAQHAGLAGRRIWSRSRGPGARARSPTRTRSRSATSSAVSRSRSSGSSRISRARSLSPVA